MTLKGYFKLTSQKFTHSLYREYHPALSDASMRQRARDCSIAWFLHTGERGEEKWPAFRLGRVSRNFRNCFHLFLSAASARPGKASSSAVFVMGIDKPSRRSYVFEELGNANFALIRFSILSAVAREFREPSQRYTYLRMDTLGPALSRGGYTRCSGYFCCESGTNTEAYLRGWCAKMWLYYCVYWVCLRGRFILLVVRRLCNNVF